MASDTAAEVDRQAPGTTSDISALAGTAATGEVRPAPRRGPGALPTVVPEAFAELFAEYAAAVSKPGGPLDADTVRAYCSRVRQFLA